MRGGWSYACPVATPTIAERLAAARGAAGHTQQECASMLLDRFGAPPRSQASMSRYLSGKQEMPVDISQAASQYISTFNAAEDPEDSSPDAPANGDPVLGADFAGLVQQFTDEPLLGPRQGALLDAVVDRLRSGPPLSHEDLITITCVMRILGASD